MSLDTSFAPLGATHPQDGEEDVNFVAMRLIQACWCQQDPTNEDEPAQAPEQAECHSIHLHLWMPGISKRAKPGVMALRTSRWFSCST